MCGLVAYLTRKGNGFTVEEATAFEQSMFINQLRGEDSTGAVLIGRDNDTGVLKVKGGWKSMLFHENYGKFRTGLLNDARMAFGHGRYATRGLVNVDNAHPFIINRSDGTRIIFMHNGTLDVWQDLPGFHMYDVDSMWLGHKIAELGAEKALSKIFGAIACMWWDTRDHSFNFFHNDQRPLAFGRPKDGGFIINSELGVLQYLNTRFGLNMDGPEDMYNLKEQVLFRIHPNAKGKEAGTFEQIDIEKPIHIPRVENAVWYGGSTGGSMQSGFRKPLWPNDPPPEEDKEWWDRRVETIEWRDGKKIVSYRNRDKVEFNEAPPEEGLLRMYELKQSGDIQKVYMRDTGKTEYVVFRFDEWKERKRQREVADRIGGLYTIQGNTVKFRTRLANTKKVIKHQGEFLDGRGHPYLKFYKNGQDGGIGVGERVTVEMMYVEERPATGTSNTMVKVACARLKETQDTYIDCVFYSVNWTKEFVERQRFFKAQVAGLRLATPGEIATEGVYVIANLIDVTPVDEQEPPTKGAVIESAPTTKTVH